MHPNFSLLFRKFFLRTLTLLVVMEFSHFSSLAQGNLQFNQVLTYTGYIIASCPQAWCTASASSPIWVVPQNKVWKIEYKSRTDGGGARFYLNGVSMADVYERYHGAGGASIAIDNAPVWLKANDEIHFEASGTYSVNHPFIISIIEYNIVP